LKERGEGARETTALLGRAVRPLERDSRGFSNDRTRTIGYYAIVAGREFTCVNASFSEWSYLYCWGRNDRGQLGDCSQTDRRVPVLVRNESECWTEREGHWGGGPGRRVDDDGALVCDGPSDDRGSRDGLCEPFGSCRPEKGEVGGGGVGAP
jgi:hypothetical protein